MKKFLIASGVAVLAFASVAGAQGYQFAANLTVGSTGPDVVALQTALIAAGFDIPAITNGTAAKGYFGSQTKTAVQAYQANKGVVPQSGFVGPLTRAVLNTGTTVSAGSTSFVCPAGYVCTQQPGTTPVTTTPGTITTPGVAGTMAFTLQSSPSGASLDKGETEDIARYKLQASASDMQVTSLALDFDFRPWLYASSIVIKDDAGAVIASKTGLTSNDFTELTVGSSYRLYVPVNYVVPRSATRYFTVTVGMLPISDRSAATLTVTQGQLRSVDGTGVTDTQTDTSNRTFSYTGSNSGQVVVTVNASSPLKRLVQISNSATTPGVTMAIFDLKSQNRDATVRTLKFYVKTDGTSVSTLVSRFKIRVAGQEYTADTVDSDGTEAGDTENNTTSSSTVTFTNLTVPLVKDTYTPVTFIAEIAQPSSIGALDGKMASTSLVANATNVVVEDSTYNAITVNSAVFVGSDMTVSASSAVLSNLSAVLGSPVSNNNTTTAYPVTFKYTLTAGDNTLYVSAIPTNALATTSTGYATAANASTTITDVTANPSQISGDDSATTPTYFVVPAGSSREFSWAGTVRTHSTTGLKTFSVTGVRYATSLTASSSTIDYNLGALKVSPVF